jgi:hypothetical protein
MDYSGLTASEFFHGVAEVSRENTIALQQIMSLQETEGAKAQSYSVGGSKGSNQDTMAKVDKRIDLEALLSKRMNDNYDYINDAYTLLYGVSQLGDDGICQLMSSSIYADLLQWRYLQCMTWSDVSERLLTPVRTLQQLEREVFETIDEENYIEKFLKNK